MNENGIQNSSNDLDLPERIAKLKKCFGQLQSASCQPRLYMADYFSTLINRVDISAKEFLANQKDQTSKISRQTRSDQSMMVQTINKSQTELFASQLEEDPELLDKIRDIGL